MGCTIRLHVRRNIDKVVQLVVQVPCLVTKGLEAHLSARREKLSSCIENSLAQRSHRAEKAGKKSGRDVARLHPLPERNISNRGVPVGSARQKFHEKLPRQSAQETIAVEVGEMRRKRLVVSNSHEGTDKQFV